MARALEEIENARRRGVDLGADIYPYIAAAHGLATEVPRLKKETDAYIEMKYYNEEKKVGGYDAVIISSTEKPDDPVVGKTIAQVARARGVSNADAALDLLVENNGTVGIGKGQHTGARPGRVVYGPGRKDATSSQ